MWAELVAKKDEWIGGQLIDYGDHTDRRIFVGAVPMRTVIVDMRLADTWFEVVGKDFACGGDREHIGLAGHPDFPVPKDGLAFQGYGGHEWHIVKPPRDELKETKP